MLSVLVHGSLSVHDPLAIAEYINELSNLSLYPGAPGERAIARSLCAEFHSGFMHLRSACPFTLEETSTAIITPEIEAELSWLKSIWSSAQVHSCIKILELLMHSILFLLAVYRHTVLNWRVKQASIKNSYSIGRRLKRL